MFRTPCSLLLVAWVVAAAAVPLSADTISYRQGSLPTAAYAHDAAEARLDGPNTTHDVGWNLNVGSLGNNLPTRVFLGYNLTGLPPSIITGVTLTLSRFEGNLGPTRPIEIHRVTAAGPIVESQLTWNKYDATHNWATPGGDFSPTVLSSLAIAETSGPNTWASTPAFVAAVQDALDNHGGRLELALLSPLAEATNSVVYRGYRADEAGVSERPLLTIDYVIPEPAAGVLLAAGCVLTLGRCRRAAR